ncbi:MAG: alanine--tRNA ligase [Verrucomicrobiota bacterium]
MTSTQIRQSFLNFFKSKQHTIVPSSSLMPDSPNLLFTNAGMNQFVPIFLGQTQCPYTPGRAADTQKCIRAGGKHNDLDDVGLDTYHHTFFEMLGNWSFGDYFKPEAIDWAWELVVKVWKFPPQRLYATVFCPYLGEPGWEQKWAIELEQVLVLAMTSQTYIPPNANASPFQIADQEAAMFWVKKFQGAGCDPKLHIVPGNKKDNFWMMGETGPCGPCTEIHVDLTPDGNTRGSLVNKGDARCIEIWNNVFIQFNANPDGTFAPLPAKHVDTGMGFERVTSIIQGTKGLTDFKNAKISNYETDIFRPIFDAIEKLSGKRYTSTLPTLAIQGEALAAQDHQQSVDIAFRVIADHIRTLSFAIADGIQPGNTDRNYVLRRILRRAVRYGRTLGFHEPFFYKLVDVLAATMGDIFPEIRAKKQHVQDVIRIEEETFNKTLDRGIALFNEEVIRIKLESNPNAKQVATPKPGILNPYISGEFAFKLYDTYGFPLDLTELMAREGHVGVDKEEFEKLMEEQRNRARAAQKKEVISLSQVETTTPTKFVGFDALQTAAKVLEVVAVKDKTAVILDASSCYAEMGGQVGDTGEIFLAATGRAPLRITNTQKSGNTWLHVVESETPPAIGEEVVLRVDAPRRQAIQRHHTVTHLLHWALHEVASKEASQKGSFVGPDKLTFDFNSAPLTPVQVADIEKLVNERILENAGVSWTEVLHNDVKGRKDVMQFFGEKYGDNVRVVQIGGEAGQLNGYSMELCGGTHTRATGEIGLFRIVSEAAVAAGVRRIEAVAGLTAYDLANQQLQLIKSIAGKINSPVGELEKKIEALLAHQKALEKEVQIALQRNASNAASELLPSAQTVNGIPLITHNLGDANGDFLQAIADALKGRFKGVVVLGGGSENSVALVATVSGEYTAKVQAGKIIQAIAPIVGGKGGGKPDNARGGGKDASKLDEALAKAKSLLG